MFLKGMKLVEIASQLNLPDGTVRRWKSTYDWDNERSDKKSERSEKKKTGKKKNVADEVDDVCENHELTDKQRLFCVLYVRCFNATKAYQKAYQCGYDVANAEGYKLLVKPCVKSEIHRLKQNRLNREMLDEYDIFQKYMDIAFADITDYVEFGQEEVQVMNMFGPVKTKDPETGEEVPLKKTVNTVRLKESKDVDGTIISEVKQGKDGSSIKLADRMKALQWLSDHMNIATDEQKARIEQIRAQTERIAYEHSDQEDDGVEIINDAPKESKDFRDSNPEIPGYI